ncbi:archaellin/type IV pilin N-terminal domain-containing protein [Halorussus amylolyticus]|uniref:archaellin/type IV pilin N-terminal domain-containing protein n=1 Tax=Halorussus amylolyticus TaxID=1126242 RepID=UPI00138F0182|nr:archaellin/type IV pilin N-terminal domain-containing protein [Halorussus amylolyticus]
MDEEKNKASNVAPTIEFFITENYRLLTVISVFGALATYLSQFPATPNGQIGVGGSLILFLITISIAMKKISLIVLQIMGSKKEVPFFRKLGYLGLFMGFFGISLTVLSLMAEEYPKESGELIQPIAMHLGAIAYIGFLFESDRLTGYNGNSRLQTIVRTAPYVSVFFVLVTVAVTWSTGNLLIPENPGKELGYLAGLAIYHSIFTLIIAGPAYFFDSLVGQ